MLIEGWAVADENAPGEYRALERIAENRGAGLWSGRITNFR